MTRSAPATPGCKTRVIALLVIGSIRLGAPSVSIKYIAVIGCFRTPPHLSSNITLNFIQNPLSGLRARALQFSRSFL